MTTQVTMETADRSATGIGFRSLVFLCTTVGLVNAEYFRMFRTIKYHGLISALFETFEISGVTLLGIAVAMHLAWKAPDRPVKRWEIPLFVGVGALVALPASGLSAVATTILGLYLLLYCSQEEHWRKLALMLVVLSYSIMWSPLIFHFFMAYILRIDAYLVGLLANAEVYDNLVKTVDSNITLQVAIGCSSFNNLSIALVGTTIARALLGPLGFARTYAAISMAVFAVVLINVVRIALIVKMPHHYELIHGDVGAMVANVVTTAAVIGAIVLATRRSAEA